LASTVWAWTLINPRQNKAPATSNDPAMGLTVPKTNASILPSMIFNLRPNSQPKTLNALNALSSRDIRRLKE
jgi:hypothetical protein